MADDALEPVVRRARRSTGHAGPGTLYRKGFARLAFGYAILGATQRDLAELFGVSHCTIDNWMATHAEFREAIQTGSRRADARVAASYYRRAAGYNTTTTKVETRELRDLDGNLTGTVTITTTTETHVPADATAGFRWLQIRQGWLVRPTPLTVDDIVRIAKAARAEATRRGIDIAAALEAVQEPVSGKCPTCGAWRVR